MTQEIDKEIEDIMVNNGEEMPDKDKTISFKSYRVWLCCGADCRVPNRYGD